MQCNSQGGVLQVLYSFEYALYVIYCYSTWVLKCIAELRNSQKLKEAQKVIKAWSIMNQFQFTITIPNDRGDLIGPEGILLDPNFVQIGFLEIVNCNCKL